MTASRWLVVFATFTLIAVPAAAQTLTGAPLASALRAGGAVIVMRHAASPREAPDKAAANPDNPTAERQLDATGRATATTMGGALRRLKIPVGTVWTSPTYRARETVRLAQLPAAQAVAELGDGGQSMQVAAAAQAAWLKKIVTELPRATNTIVVTHMPNIAAAFPEAGAVADGEALIFMADGKGGARLAGRVRIEEWPSLR